MTEEARLAGDLNRGPLLVRLISFGIPLVLGMFLASASGPIMKPGSSTKLTMGR